MVSNSLYNNKECRVMIMAGGTGGHVFPALAVADELRATNVSVSWLGTRAGIEAELVPSSGIKLNFLDIEGIRGRGLAALIKAPLLLWRSIRQSLSVLAEYKPQVVLGMGGFASGPGAVAARLKGIPIVIHEQNSVAGTTNRIVAELPAALCRVSRRIKAVNGVAIRCVRLLPSCQLRISVLRAEPVPSSCWFWVAVAAHWRLIS